MTNTLKIVIGIVVTFFCVLFVFGAFIAIQFEVSGFGRPQDADPREWYILLQFLVMLVCGVLPYLVVTKFVKGKVRNKDEGETLHKQL